ncbi:hypothetical protein GmRootV59_17190 [Variovorax sp. V59]
MAKKDTSEFSRPPALLPACVSAGYSLKLHAGTTLLPGQVVVHAPLGKNGALDLPKGFSLMDCQARDFPGADRRDGVGDLRTPVRPGGDSGGAGCGMLSKRTGR